jgi:hypothetical protein
MTDFNAVQRHAAGANYALGEMANHLRDLVAAMGPIDDELAQLCERMKGELEAVQLSVQTFTWYAAWKAITGIVEPGMFAAEERGDDGQVES